MYNSIIIQYYYASERFINSRESRGIELIYKFTHISM